MGNKSSIKIKKLTLAQQAIGLAALYPDSKCSVHRNDLLWRGVLVPTPLSNSYEVEISYSLGSSPKVYALSPQLFVPAGMVLPHVYDHKEQRLCLYYPLGKPDWNSSMFLARTIVPWASEWFFYYELWLATGEWLGGGVHPSTPKKDSQKEKS